MSLALRRLLFLAFVLAFLVTAPLVVLYTAGYRINQTTGRIQQTGVIAISTSPKSADITLNGTLKNSRSPYVIQRLMPGTYTLLLEKKGYHDWEQKITVESGRTTYVSALLLAEADPALMLEETVDDLRVSEDGRTVTMLIGDQVWTYDVPTRTQQLTAATEIVDVPLTIPSIELHDNGTNVEIRRVNDSGSSLLGILPLSTYTVMHASESEAVLRDTRGRTFLLNVATGVTSTLDIPSTIVDWNDETQLLLASDGNEIDIVSLTTGEKTFITRQSEPFVSLAWHPSGTAIIAATADSISIIEIDRHASRQVTTLIDNIEVTTMWPDVAGKTVYFFGTIDGIAGIYSIKLTK